MRANKKSRRAGTERSTRRERRDSFFLVRKKVSPLNWMMIVVQPQRECLFWHLNQMAVQSSGRLPREETLQHARVPSTNQRDTHSLMAPIHLRISRRVTVDTPPLPHPPRLIELHSCRCPPGFLLVSNIPQVSRYRRVWLPVPMLLGVLVRNVRHFVCWCSSTERATRHIELKTRGRERAVISKSRAPQRMDGVIYGEKHKDERIGRAAKRCVFYTRVRAHRSRSPAGADRLIDAR